jgi:hypothetical protein
MRKILLFEVEVNDPMTFTLVTLLPAGIACWLPGSCAARNKN